MKKIGFIVLALVLLLGTLGIGYSAWTDQVVITGTVKTGSLDLEVVEYSGMWFWKIPGANPEYYFTTDPLWRSTDPNAFLVAYAASSQGQDNDQIIMTFDNLFPLDTGVPIHGPGGGVIGNQYAWRANFVIHYNGTVPAMVGADFTAVAGDPELLALWQPFPAQNFRGIWVIFERLDETYDPDSSDPLLNDPWKHLTGIYVNDAVQMHYCDYVIAWMCVEIPQNNDYQDLGGTFTAEINAIQWNEYVP